MTDLGPDGRTSPSSHGTARRQRAPTITIDTSAVSPPFAEHDALPLQPLSDRPPSLQGDQPTNTNTNPTMPREDPSPTELRPAHSFESKDSRPKSSHNVLPPASKWGDLQPKNFLAVPNTRSRGNSVDSEDQGHSPTSYSGETHVPSTAPSEEALQCSTAQGSENILNDEDALTADPGTEADFYVSDNRFAFSPGQLSKLLNPKSYAAFHALGGLRGIEKGLRTDRMAGLSVDEKQLDGSVSFDDAISAGKDSATSSHLGRSLTRASTSATMIQQSEDSFTDRKRIFKDNRLPEKKSKTIFELAWLAFNDKVIILLTVAAVVSLALGIYQSVEKVDGESIQWVEGVAIVIAIVIVVSVGAVNDWQKERQFVKLNKKKEDRTVKVIRSGKSREISVYDILVGDVVHLEPGDIIPVDGVFISGHNLKCDESSATGESDLVKKHSGDEVYAALESHQSVTKMDPFIISGGKVTEGIGTFLVTAVGINSSYGKTMMALREDPQTTPLQSKLNVLAEYIAKLGLSAGLILFIAVFIRFLINLPNIKGGASQKGQVFLQVFIVAVTIVVVAVPEGLPLAVTLALAFATTRMLKDNNLVRLLRACETMGNATTVCSDKTGTLTQNRMSVVAGTLGVNARFGDKQSPENSETNSPETPTRGKLASSVDDGRDAHTTEFISRLDENIKTRVKQSIAINSTAFEGDEEEQESFVGSKTETALLSFARLHLGMGPLSEERANAQVVQFVPFDSGRKCMAAAIKLGDGRYRLLVKGAAEIMVEHCSRIVDDATKGTTEIDLGKENRTHLMDVINEYASRSLRTIGLVYRDFEQWPPQGVTTLKDDPKQASFQGVFQKMVFLGIVGIQDPLRQGVADAVRACQDAGVFVRMVTGDNLFTAKAIATECGIYTEGGVIMEGPVFRKLGKFQMNEVIPKLQVLARSSPEDKRILVQRLKDMGETVAVTGDGTNDAPALKTADVGFSMGIAGTEVAKEASAIILMDDNFASIVKAIMWGRAVNDAVKKFLQVSQEYHLYRPAANIEQFQVTVNITAVILTFISAVASSNQQSVLTAVQLLWVNLIMDTFAALALATDPPTPSILNRKPEPKSAPLITTTMWKMIVGQSLYQLIVTLVLNFAGVKITGYSEERYGEHYMQTLIFNTFVWMQIFNQYNNRRLDNKFNIFEGVHRNTFFIAIQFIIVAGQVMIVFVGGAAFSVVRQHAAAWGIALVLGFVSIPLAVLIRLIPDRWVRKMVPSWLRSRAKPQVLVSDEEQQYSWNPALVEIREELSFLKAIRGGRLTTLVYKLQHPRETLLARSRSGSPSRNSSIPGTPIGEQNGDDTGNSLAPPRTPDSRRSTTSRRRGRSRSNSAFAPAAAMAGIIAGSVAGWSPIGRREEQRSSGVSQDHNRSTLEDQEGVEVHPDTKPDDPVVVRDLSTTLEPPSQNPEITPHSQHTSDSTSRSQHTSEGTSRSQPASDNAPPSQHTKSPSQ